MYPASELTALADRRRKIQSRIRTTRGTCAAACRRIEGALEAVDGWLSRFRTWSGLAVLVLPFVRRRGRGARRGPSGKLRTALRWTPLLWRLYRALRSLVPPVPDDVPNHVKAEQGR